MSCLVKKILLVAVCISVTGSLVEASQADKTVDLKNSSAPISYVEARTEYIKAQNKEFYRQKGPWLKAKLFLKQLLPAWLTKPSKVIVPPASNIKTLNSLKAIDQNQIIKFKYPPEQAKQTWGRIALGMLCFFSAGIIMSNALSMPTMGLPAAHFNAQGTNSSMLATNSTMNMEPIVTMYKSFSPLGTSVSR